MRASVAYVSSRTGARCRRTFQRCSIPMRERCRLTIGGPNEATQAVVGVRGGPNGFVGKNKFAKFPVIKGGGGFHRRLPQTCRLRNRVRVERRFQNGPAARPETVTDHFV